LSGFLGLVHGIGIEAAGIGGVGAVVDAVEEVGRLAGDHDDRPGGSETHDLVRRQQGPPLEVFARPRRTAAGRVLKPVWEDWLVVR
jgi:hypothetical protein